MVENKKIETPKAGAEFKSTSATLRTPVDQAAESVKTPTVAEVKNPQVPSGKENIDAHVGATAKSIEAANKAEKDVASAEPFVKPVVKTVPALTPDERLKDQVDKVGESIEAYNQSEKDNARLSGPDALQVPLKKEISRVAPLTGELRPDPENDSYVSPGKTLSPVAPAPGELVPEVEEPPLTISPLTGEIKRLDEISYPTPGHVRDTGAFMKDIDTKKFVLDSKQSKFNVPLGHQVSLLEANREAWANDEAIREDREERAHMLAEAMLSSDGLRRTRRVQKNLR